ncbi:hypothetical protein [Leptospira noguchii]|uniref:Uncharacterized protein n=1 Tax=Leptospira noguchii TaxID=28182 RepID=A0AAE9GDF5_9LEPT|nr:hypothetical protein [Leptospira noguchii]UOG55887.1 hypothetical protein MAL03_13610 [Leptospira noguchii]
MERKELSKTLFTKAFETKALRSLEVTQRLAPRTQQNAFYESVLGRSTGRVGNSTQRSLWIALWVKLLVFYKN